MKTVTMTTQNAYNYGGTLQAYALNKALRNLGVEDKLLNFYRDTRDEYYKPFKISGTMHRDLFNNFVSFIYKGQLDKRKRSFDEFIEKNIETTPRYNNMEELRSAPPKADVFITGGDQMMNVSNNHTPKEHLGFREQFEFETKNARRISYSSSMGSNSIFEGYQDEFKKRLLEYDAISVREDKTKDFLEGMVDCSVNVNVDPVFLLDKDEWGNFTGKKKEKYILVYSLLNNPVLNDIIQKIKEDTGLPVWVINPWPRCYTNGDRIIRDAGPAEFLNLIKNAEYVVSTSFHGVCFSIIFEKNFYCLVRKEGDIRYESLLNKFGLSDRIVRYKEDVNYNDIDFNIVKKVVADELEHSLTYLKEALEI